MAMIVQCVTIITSCIPYLRKLLSSLPSGMYMSDELRRRGLGSVDRSAGTVNGSDASYIIRMAGSRTTPGTLSDFHKSHRAQLDSIAAASSVAASKSGRKPSTASQYPFIYAGGQGPYEY